MNETALLDALDVEPQMGPNDIPFTQFLRPDGRRADVWITRSPEVAEKARQILAAGLVFECEELTGGTVSLTIADKEKEVDVGIQLCPNGPQVPDAVDRLVMEFKLPYALFLSYKGGEVSALDISQLVGHTPGPWEVTGSFGGSSNGHTFGTRDKSYGTYTLDAAGNPVLSGTPRTLGCTYDNACTTSGMAESEANVRLIAAAPALLEEVRRLRALVSPEKQEER